MLREIDTPMPAPEDFAEDGAGERVSRGRQLLLDDASHQQLAATFRALADSSRAKIVYSLLWQDLCTSDLAAIIGTSESAVSQHLRLLRELRIVRTERRGKMVVYSLDDDHIRTLLSVALSHIRDAGSQPQKIGQMLSMMRTSSYHDEDPELNADED